jgi:outer membrane protein assembly factor BamB
VAGPLSVAPDGSVVYNTLTLDLAAPWTRDVGAASLVRVTADDRAVSVSYAGLIPGAPGPEAPCEGQFDNADLPWPPTPDARPPRAPCGSQRPGVNVAPAIGPNGVVVTVSRAHLNSRYGYLVALNPDLTLRWAASLRDRLNDGCGSSLLPPNGAPGGCRVGAPSGVDPATGGAPAGRVQDLSTSSPVIAPDGSILYGAFTRYNGARGHLMRFDANGRFLQAYDYGWDVTPALHLQGSRWSAIVKDNDYGAGSYCDVPSVCPREPAGPFRLVQLSSELIPEWRSDPAPAEWCINAPAVDAEGTVFALNEDGHLYAIRQGGAVRDRILLARAVGAAYTPLAIGGDGRIFALNYGRLFVVGR